MARIPYADPDKAPEQVREALDRLPQLNIFRMLANAESVFRPFLRFGDTLLSGLELNGLLRELAILRVARLTPHAEYEWVQHEPIARAVGADDQQLAALERDEIDADCFDPAQRATLRFTGEVVRDARASDETFAELAALLPPRQIVELLLVIGQYMMLARVMATLELELDEPAAPGALPFSG
jgi:4-carboxymuconolactone decarboxylase